MGGPHDARGWHEFTLPADRAILDHLRTLDVDHRWLHDTILVFSDYGVALTIGALLVGAVLPAVRRGAERRGAIAALGASASAYAATVALKEIVHRTPPYASGRLAAGQTLSPVFPEGPGAIYVALAVGLWNVSRPLAVAAALTALADGFIQVAMGSHWPSDLVAAWALGGVAGLGARRVTAASTAAFRG